MDCGLFWQVSLRLIDFRFLSIVIFVLPKLLVRLAKCNRHNRAQCVKRDFQAKDRRLFDVKILNISVLERMKIGYVTNHIISLFILLSFLKKTPPTNTQYFKAYVR